MFVIYRWRACLRVAVQPDLFWGESRFRFAALLSSYSVRSALLFVAVLTVVLWRKFNSCTTIFQVLFFSFVIFFLQADGRVPLKLKLTTLSRMRRAAMCRNQFNSVFVPEVHPRVFYRQHFECVGLSAPLYPTLQEN